MPEPTRPIARRRPLTSVARVFAVSVAVAVLTVATAQAGTPRTSKATAAHSARVRYQTLQHSYPFNHPLGRQWGVYDSTWAGDPYSRVPSLVTVSAGMLHVKTSYRSGSGLCLCMHGGNPAKPYGRWVIRARATKNADHGFAIMLWPVAEDWPIGGEIDIAEYPTANRKHVEFTVHYGVTNSRIAKSYAGDFTKWHNYSVEWTPTFIRYRIDGKVLTTITNKAAIPSRPMHLALQAGATTGKPSRTSSTLDVAWIKSYR